MKPEDNKGPYVFPDCIVKQIIVLDVLRVYSYDSYDSRMHSTNNVYRGLYMPLYYAVAILTSHINEFIKTIAKSPSLSSSIFFAAETTSEDIIGTFSPSSGNTTELRAIVLIFRIIYILY